MSVIITASQAVESDIVSDRHGTLWRRENAPTFELVNQGASVTLADYGIKPVDECQISVAHLGDYAPLTLLMRDGKPVGATLPEPKPPRIVEFEYYLHGGKPYEEREEWSRKLGFTVSDELLEKMGQPFYEVTLSCTLDTQTGQVVILGAK